MKISQPLITLMTLVICINAYSKDVDKAKLELNDKVNEAARIKSSEVSAKEAAEREKKRSEEIFTQVTLRRAETDKAITDSKQKLAEYERISSEQAKVILDYNKELEQLKIDNEKALKITKETSEKTVVLKKERAVLVDKIKKDTKIITETKKKLAKVEAANKAQQISFDKVQKDVVALEKVKNAEEKTYETTKKKVEENIAKFDETRIELKAKSDNLQKQIDDLKAKGVELKKKEIEVKNNRDKQKAEYVALNAYLRELKKAEVVMISEKKKADREAAKASKTN